MFVTEAIQSLLSSQSTDLTNRWSPELETQVFVTKGEPDGKRFTDGDHTWWNIRIPKGANTKSPKFKNYEISWPLERYTTAIGCTGWDWQNKVSKWFGYDFDSITGHEGVGVDADELDRVREAATGLPYVEIRTSTSGEGYHLYVHVDDLPTANHTEHAAAARAVLRDLMTVDCAYDFADSVDVDGKILWIWHKNQKPKGLKQIKAHTASLSPRDVPSNWKQYLNVINRTSQRVTVPGADSAFEALTSEFPSVPLDDGHRQLIQSLRRAGYSTVWDCDRRLLQTHTKGLKDIPHKGLFETISPGRDKGTPNCFMFPTHESAWKVFRFGGSKEHPSWQESDGRVWAFYNRDTDLETAARCFGGAPLAGGGYTFAEAKGAVAALGAMSHEVELPKDWDKRAAELKISSTKILLRVRAYDADPEDVHPWEKKRKFWQRVVTGVKSEVCIDERLRDADQRLRVLRTEAGQAKGALAWTNTIDDWAPVCTQEAKARLQSLGMTATEAVAAIGLASQNPYINVNVPFQGAWLPGRRYAGDAAQFAVPPTPKGSVANHPTWDRMCRHLGQSLDPFLQKLEWAQDYGVATGDQYIKMWLANVIRHPFDALPYLFFYDHGYGDSGKSSLHESIRTYLFSRGVPLAREALTGDFNGPLEGAVIVAIDEDDLNKPGVYDKLKFLVTAKWIIIRRMRTDEYMVLNTCHFMHCANSIDRLPAFTQDTRITMCNVPKLPVRIPRPQLDELVEAEAASFLGTLLEMDLPEPIDRMRLPMVVTDDKRRLQSLNQSPVDAFINEECHEIPGAKVKLAEFTERLQEWLSSDERDQWCSSRKVKQKLMERFPVGNSTGNAIYVGNLTFNKSDAASEPFIMNGRRLSK